MRGVHCLSTEQALSDADERLPVTVFNAEGHRVPMLFVRSWFGELTPYQRLARELGKEQPLFTVAPPMGDSKDAYPGSTQQWAQWIYHSIRGLHGDFILGGNSFGGVLAMHLTLELKPTDLHPLHIALIDTSLPRKSYFQPKSRVHWLIHNLNSILQLPAEERMDYLKTGLAQRKQRRLKRRAPKPPKDRNATDVITSTGNKMPLLQRAIWVSYLKYQPRSWDLPVTLLRTAESHERSGDALLGWSPWLTGPVHTSPIEGRHLTVLAPRHVGCVAARLADLGRLVNESL